MKKIKKWLQERFLPMWAKESVMADNKRMSLRIRELEHELQQKEAYIAGLEAGMRAQRRIIIHNGEGNK